ncbi:MULTISPECIES: hypothetical protein [unclassified Roseofilum]|uniref:hypothetical protein n=1 Tax=unclassified Roseofilum TaxID=2620099 RepID=UPI001B0521A3|nr:MULTISPECIES: hypothetical protein [unclassified Roseofilum]MBP0009302.1 hypothetical protein [Roseofilum sp. Belize Diploria]MBP0032920.1 hypothetical protein [Roseofilum sp. Belize BBD 4]
MGEKFVNYQVKSSSLSVFSISDICEAVKKITKSQAYITPEKNGWFSIYDRTSEEFIYHEISAFAQKVSEALSSTVFAFIVLSGINFIYLLYDSGELIDEFYDDPESFTFGYEYVNDKIRKQFQGNPQKILTYCVEGTTLQDLLHFFDICKKNEMDHYDGKKIQYYGMDAVEEFVVFLGIDEERATTGYKYLEDDKFYGTGLEMEDAEDFILVEASSI